MQANYPRLKDALEGVKWVLERDPESLPIMFEFDAFVGRGIKIDPWPDVPKAIVYFRIEGSDVCLYAIYDTAPCDAPVM